MNSTPGTLYLVGTPIGNLEDITLRAVRVLREVDLVAAEDTRVTRVLLQRYEIRTRLISYHEHSGPGRLQEILDALRQGESVAFVSDAGMPGVSDPGAKLVKACADAAIPVSVAPGPTAASAALALSGLPMKEHLFLGFLPSRAGQRREALRRAKDQVGALVLFEAPHRVRESLEDMHEVLGDRPAACCRELTKRFEEVVRGTISELVAHFAENEPRGEFTIVVAGAPAHAAEGDLGAALEEARELIAAGLSASRAVAHVARRRGVSKSALYRAVLDQGRGDEG
jgi:16S rRNA (cytidine1402-2'-O)-methyltransferase